MALPREQPNVLYLHVINGSRTQVKMHNKQAKSFRAKANRNKSSCLCGCCAIIKEHISTLVVDSFIVMIPNHVVMPHRAHSFIVNV